MLTVKSYMIHILTKKTVVSRARPSFLQQFLDYKNNRMIEKQSYMRT